jgi:hypothetical protein
MLIFGKKAPNANAQIEREIAASEGKKQMLTTSVLNEVNSLYAKLTDRFAEIGSITYTSHMNGNFSIELLIDMFDEITELKKSIDEKEAKIKEISERYDEEINLMKNLTANVTADVTANVAGSDTVCKCGTARKDDDLFCQKCGEKY